MFKFITVMFFIYLFSYFSVFSSSSDQRREILDTTILPWCATGRLLISFKHRICSSSTLCCADECLRDRVYTASGCLIENNIILTAAHNLFFRNNTEDEISHRKRWEPEPYLIEFYPGYPYLKTSSANGDPETVCFTHKEFHVMDEWKNLFFDKTSAINFDVGVIILKENVRLPWYGGGVTEIMDFPRLSINVTGFPLDEKQLCRYNGEKMYTTDNTTISDLNGTCIGIVA